MLHQIGEVLSNHPKTLLLGGTAAWVSYGLLLSGARRKAYFRPITAPISSLITVIGFGANMADDLFDAIRDGRIATWKEALDALEKFLQDSGLEDEFSNTLSSHRLLTTLRTLTDIQNKVQRQRRRSLRHHQADDDEMMESMKHVLAEGQRYMRYATAVYGPEMMGSTQLAVFGELVGTSVDSNHTLIARHCQLKIEEPQSTDNSSPKDPSWEVWCDFTRDPTTTELHHAQHSMVVCNHETKSIILAVRGTFSVSGIITDLAGYCDDFCGGKAHSGMAQAATETWSSLWSELLRPKFASLPQDYQLVITGHSLGGGVACLINILVHHRRSTGVLPELEGRTVECWPMAPPPVFGPLSAAPDAVAHTVAFVHAYDVVPSLSVDSIRRFMACLDRIDAALGANPEWEAAMQRWELADEPLPGLVETYHPPQSTTTTTATTEGEASLRELPRAPMIFVPCRQIIWLEKTSVEDEHEEPLYEAHVLDPTAYVDRVLDFEIPNCITDHMTPEYEVAFSKVVGGGGGKE